MTRSTGIAYTRNDRNTLMQVRRRAMSVPASLGSRVDTLEAEATGWVTESELATGLAGKATPAQIAAAAQPDHRRSAGRVVLRPAPHHWHHGNDQRRL